MPTLNSKNGKSSWPWPGLDIRGDGGFAVAMGNNCNGPYVRLRDLVPDPFYVLPEEVRTLLANHREQEYRSVRNIPAVHRRAPSRFGVDYSAKALNIASRDGRNNAGFWLACQLRDNEFSSGEAEAAMRDYQSRVPSANTKGKRELYTEAEMMASVYEAYPNLRVSLGQDLICVGSRILRRPRRYRADGATGMGSPKKTGPRRGKVRRVLRVLMYTWDARVSHYWDTRASRPLARNTRECRAKFTQIRVWKLEMSASIVSLLLHVGGVQ